MTLTLLEGAVDALYTYLHAGITAKLAAVNARHTDGITLEAVKLWYQGALPFNQPEVPSIALCGNDWNPNQNEEYFSGASDIDIIIMVGDAEPTVRFRKLCRYAVAIIELLQVSDALLGYNYLMNGQVKLSDILSTPEFLQAISIPIKLVKPEA